ncbi:MAG: 30S ribosomal protein S19 [Candidatus Micrarchaeota archaeon]
MAKKEFTYKGKTIEELQKMSVDEFAKLVPSRKRRTLERGIKEAQKRLIKTAEKSDGRKPVKTHLREMIIIPQFIGKKFAVHDGKDWNQVEVKPEMIGHCLGEFSMTRERVTHSGPGIGATRGTKFVSVK